MTPQLKAWAEREAKKDFLTFGTKQKTLLDPIDYMESNSEYKALLRGIKAAMQVGIEQGKADANKDVHTVARMLGDYVREDVYKKIENEHRARLGQLLEGK